jgi:hypothetical protein
MPDDEARVIPLPPPIPPREAPLLSEILAKLRWSVESEGWSAHLTPAESGLLLAILAEPPSPPNMGA